MDNFKVCAHRFSLEGSTPSSWEAPIGRCFMLDPDVTPVEDKLSYEILPCEGRQDNKGRYNHEWFGHCQVTCFLLAFQLDMLSRSDF